MEYRIFDSELKILEILWEGGALSAKDVAAQAADQVGWSKTTTYTVLKKLVERGVLRNENAVVTAVVPKEDILREESRAVVDRTFAGSLPSFLTYFMGGKTISDAEADELKAIIDRYREGDHHA